MIPTNIHNLAVNAASAIGGRYKLAAVVFKSTRPLAVAHNRMGQTHPLTLRHPYHPDAGVHAELAAVLKVRWKVDLGRCRLYVVRVMLDGGLGMSKPCKGCASMLREYGVGRVFYNDGGVVYESVCT